MPQGQKRKAGAQGKRHQGQDDTESLRGDQSAAAAAAAGVAATAEEVSPSTPVSGGSPPSTPAPGPFLTPQRASAAYSPEAGVSCPRSDEGAQSLGEESTSTSGRAPATLTAPRRHLTREASVLVQCLLEKYKKNESITWAGMIKVLIKQYKQQFLGDIRRASDHMELLFGLELKEVDPSNHTYALIDMMDLSGKGSLSRDRNIPKTGLLMHILGVIFMKGNRATEEEVWKYLSLLEVYAGRRHAIFGEPKKLITIDLVQENYLEYRQVPDSDPPRYEFLWGPRAHAETTKMKVLQIIARLNETVPSSFPTLYEEALRDEEERAAAKVANIAKASAPSEAKSHSSSQI